MARPDDKQSPGGFETSTELRRTEQAERRPEPPPAMSEPSPAYRTSAGPRTVVIAAGVALVVLAVAVILYLVG